MTNRHGNLALISYVPSPHSGYLKLFRKYSERILYILGSDFIKEFSPLVRNLPGNSPEDVRLMVLALGIFCDVRILTRDSLDEVRSMEITMPDEDVSRAIAKVYFSKTPIAFDGSWRLRWHKDAVMQGRRPEGERMISREAFDRELMREAFKSAERSSDWWRQVGALLVRDKEVLLVAFNKHGPSEQTPYLYGDPRSNFEPGECIDVSTALHAEIGIIAEAARTGLQMKGCDLYVTTFPCPPCASACANSGIRRLFYTDGYSLVEGANILQSCGVEIIRVDMNFPSLN